MTFSHFLFSPYLSWIFICSDGAVFRCLLLCCGSSSDNLCLVVTLNLISSWSIVCHFWTLKFAQDNSEVCQVAGSEGGPCEEAVWVERNGECLILHFKCPCGKGYQILLTGKSCYYKLTAFWARDLLLSYFR